MKNLEKSEELYGLEYSSSKDDEVKNHHSSDLTETDSAPLKVLADISEDELNEFIELQEEAPKKRRRQKPRESFVCFISFYESIKLMPERLHLRAFRVLMDYAFYREEPPTKTPARIMQSFVSWRKQVDVNSQKYDRKVESNWGRKDDDEKADNDGT